MEKDKFSVMERCNSKIALRSYFIHPSINRNYPTTQYENPTKKKKKEQKQKGQKHLERIRGKGK